MRYVALLRAVKVGGTGKLPMADLRRICAECGFGRVGTYIASGNVLLDSDRDAAGVKATLEAALADAGLRTTVFVRTGPELAAVLAADPFPDEAGNRVLVTFLDQPTTPATLDGVRHRAGERIALGPREIHVGYGEGMAASKLHIPAAAAGTARNRNTVAKLAAMADA